MTEHRINVEKIFDGHKLHTNASLQLNGQQIIGLTDEVAADKSARIKGLVTPGFVDLQVNGGGDVLLNTTPTRKGIQTIAAAHRKLGTVAIMPTVITDHPDVLELSLIHI